MTDWMVYIIRNKRHENKRFVIVPGFRDATVEALLGEYEYIDVIHSLDGVLGGPSTVITSDLNRSMGSLFNIAGRQQIKLDEIEKRIVELEAFYSPEKAKGYPFK